MTIIKAYNLATKFIFKIIIMALIIISFILLCIINGVIKLIKVVSFEHTIENIKSKISTAEKVEENK